MQSPANNAGSSWMRWQTWLLCATLAALVVIVTPKLFGNPLLNSGDAHVYEAQMDLVFSGQRPYLDFRFEHLPLTLIPMALAHAVAVATGLAYAWPLLAINLAMVYATAAFVARIAATLGIEPAGRRFVVMSAPMLLIVPFRLDALSTLLAVAAVWYAMAAREQWSAGAAIGGILAKGWPVVLAATDWWRDERRRARLLAVFAVAIGVAMLALPGFRAGRSFDGVHQETISGSIIIVARLLTGTKAGIVHWAGAEYVEAGGYAVLLNLAVGAVVVLAAVPVLRRPFTWQGGIALTGALTYGLLLASPLLSAQFLWWPIPFVALVGARRSRVTLTAAAALSVTLVAVWAPEALWWHSGWLARNALLLAGAVFAVADVRRISSLATARSLHPAAAP